LVGEIAFFGNPPTRNATVIAHEASTVIVIIKFGMEQMMDKYPDLYESVRVLIEERSK
jgi:CRP-like cAMP-binding protein